MTAEKEFVFTHEDFNYLRRIVTETTGIVANEDKYGMYYSRLVPRVRHLGLKDFSQYRLYLQQHMESESIELVNSVTTNLTSFFRENHHFEFIKDTLVPYLVKRGDKKIRIWSAGCSTGEEPYSIAMILAESIPDYKSWDIKVYATDLDSQVISQASKAVYDESRMNSLEPRYLQQYFSSENDENSKRLKLNPDIVELVKFFQLNLLHAWGFNELMDCVFCRNVVIYFDAETKFRLVERFAHQIKQDGYLMMGHSESLYKTTDRFKLLGQTVYQKVAPEPKQ